MTNRFERVPKVTFIVLLFVCLRCSAHRRAPQFAYEEASGCGGVIVSTWNGAGTEVLSVEIDRKLVQLAPGITRTYEIAKLPAGVRVVLELFSSRAHNWRCSDVMNRNAEDAQLWSAVGGRLSVTIGTATAAFEPYPVTLELKDGVFRSSDGRTASVGRPLTIFGGAGTGPGG